MHAVHKLLILPTCCSVGSVEGVVLDAPFWRVHWYKILALLACSGVNMVSIWTPLGRMFPFPHACTWLPDTTAVTEDFPPLTQEADSCDPGL